jgi:transcriptional regulator GlxA family with amidase domain
MVGKGIYRFLYLVEYGYFFIILSMAYMLQSRFITLHNEIERLSFLMNQQIMKSQNGEATTTSAKQKILSASNSEKIQRVIEYIHANFRFDIAREGLASMIDMHPDTFSRYFKSYTGTSLPDYINHLRIDFAKELLSDTGESIITIAFKCGFENLSTFNRAFHKMQNTTPTAYRRQYRVS